VQCSPGRSRPPLSAAAAALPGRRRVDMVGTVSLTVGGGNRDLNGLGMLHDHSDRLSKT
jgi:hypothetical protein